MSGFASIYGGSGDDELAPEGLHTSDYVSAFGGNDDVTTFGGDDTVLAGGGNDVVFAGDDADVVVGGMGNDLIDGGAGRDGLFGGTGADSLIGGAGNDLLLSEAGDDLIQGGEGNDLMDGGAGQDVFDFSDNFGHDLIIGFQIGQDVLQIAQGINGTGVPDPLQILGYVSADSHGNAVITLGTDTITLNGVAPGDLTAANIASVVHIV